MMEEVSTSETSVNLYKTTQRNIPEVIFSIFFTLNAGLVQSADQGLTYGR
jgi:hypothetical protein